MRSGGKSRRRQKRRRRPNRRSQALRCRCLAASRRYQREYNGACLRALCAPSWVRCSACRVRFQAVPVSQGCFALPARPAAPVRHGVAAACARASPPRRCQVRGTARPRTSPKRRPMRCRQCSAGGVPDSSRYARAYRPPWRPQRSAPPEAAVRTRAVATGSRGQR